MLRLDQRNGQSSHVLSSYMKSIGSFVSLMDLSTDYMVKCTLCTVPYVWYYLYDIRMRMTHQVEVSIYGKNKREIYIFPKIVRMTRSEVIRRLARVNLWLDSWEVPLEIET